MGGLDKDEETRGREGALDRGLDADEERSFFAFFRSGDGAVAGDPPIDGGRLSLMLNRLTDEPLAEGDDASIGE